MKTLFVALLFAVMSLPGSSFAHGDDRPGPHGGLVFMPGPYHVELVADGKSGLMVFLLDLEFSNPVILKSTVSALVALGQKKNPLLCSESGDHFSCRIVTDSLLKGELRVSSSRDGVKGNLVAVKWPLPAPPTAKKSAAVH